MKFLTNLTIGLLGSVFLFCSLMLETVVAVDFPVVVNNERDKNAEPMDASEAAKRIQLPGGFRATVYASEPEVQNPIAMAWDEGGRMWVAENYTYSDRMQRFDLSMRDRVTILHDTNGDGHADSRKVFTDNVQMLTSVEVGRGGVWLMCPPQLLFVPDANEDDVPDGPPEVVLDGFTVAKSNYHNFANGLRWGPDGWLYGRCGHSCPGHLGRPGTNMEQRVPIDGGIWRYHPERKTVEVLTHGTVNPWGHDWDANGELFFINTVIGHLWHMMPGAHFKESFGESANPLVFDRIDMIADHYHFDRNGSWTKSRDGAANEFGGGHAHIGMMIYQSDVWPKKYHDQLFTLNMHGLRANVETLRRKGAGYVASHEPDFFVAEDPFFRGIEISVGPDGQVYVLDWSDTGECHDHTGVHRTSGRVYKIEYVDRNAPKRSFAKPACMAGSGKLPDLWRRYQAGQTTTAELFDLLNDSNEHVRVWAIRMLTDRWPLDTLHGPLPNADYPEQPDIDAALVAMARNDSAGLVQLTLASTLQRMPMEKRASLAAELVKHGSFSEDRDLPKMIWFGLMPLVEENPRELLRVAMACQQSSTMEWIARGIAGKIQSHPVLLNELLGWAADMPSSIRSSVLSGMASAFVGWQKASQPKNWRAFETAVASSDTEDKVREMNLLFGDGRALAELKQIAASSEFRIKTRQSALQTLINARPDDLRSICESLLDQRELNATAAKGLAMFDDPAVGRKLASMYRRFQSSDRPGVIELLVSRPSFASSLLDQMAATKNPIPREDVTAFHARQIMGMGDATLSDKLGEVWGTLRNSPSDRREKIEMMKKELSAEWIAKADLAAGRALYKKTCSQCHVLYGDGEKIGPDLTGAQRSSLDYLLENVLDPSAVVGKDYRMSVILTDDGRVLNGLIVSQNKKSMIVQTQNARENLAMESVEQIKETNLSPMPDGLLTTLTKEQVRDLFGYLMSPVQVSMP